MAMRKKTIKLDKKDYLRALLCDTQPTDCPIILSNDGLYLNAIECEKKESGSAFNPTCSFYKKIINPALDDSMKFEIRMQSKKSQSSPFVYCIVKDPVSLRHLSLIHPRAQVNYCEFYRDYAPVITHNASKSNYSRRYPRKVANSFFMFENDVMNKYRGDDIETEGNELMRRYSSSYFSYSGYGRKYKLFQSKEYYELEKKFSVMWMLDVSHCFDSIYTHSVAWALKSKPYIREFVKYGNQFGQELDTLMQRSNNNETNGIPIGAEFSRVFAELIFQRIDFNIENYLFSEFGFVNGKDYSILRYVDDFVLFCNSGSDAEIIYKTIDIKLKEFNLQLNVSKFERYSRPFCTKKTGVLTKVNSSINELYSKLYSKSDGVVSLAKIKDKHKFKLHFINNIKAICVDSGSSYDEVSSYVISSLAKTIMYVMHKFPVDTINSDDETKTKVKDIVFILSDIMLFFFSVSPRVSSSYKLSKIMVLAGCYLRELSSDYSRVFMDSLVNSVENINFGKGDDGVFIDGFISIEKINLVLSATFFSDNYLIGKVFFDGVLKKKKMDYFTIISLLFYFRNRKPYLEFKVTLEDEVKKILGDMELLQSSENAHLFLDVMSCPFVSIKTRRYLYRKYLKKYEPNLQRQPLEIDEDLNLLLETSWFVKWDELNLIRMIEKKELNDSY